MTDPTTPERDLPAGLAAPVGPRRVDGRWIVTAILALAVGLALVGVKFRRPSPATPPKAGQPTTTASPAPARPASSR